MQRPEKDNHCRAEGNLDESARSQVVTMVPFKDARNSVVVAPAQYQIYGNVFTEISHIASKIDKHRKYSKENLYKQFKNVLNDEKNVLNSSQNLSKSDKEIIKKSNHYYFKKQNISESNYNNFHLNSGHRQRNMVYILDSLMSKMNIC